MTAFQDVCQEQPLPSTLGMLFGHLPTTELQEMIQENAIQQLSVGNSTFLPHLLHGWEKYFDN